jgi:hypothetical protein
MVAFQKADKLSKSRFGKKLKDLQNMLPETPAPGTFAALRIFSRLRLFLRFGVDKPFCKFPGLSRCSMLAPGDPLGICGNM